MYKIGKWKKRNTYQEIVDQFTAYVSRHYMNESIVIFGRYPAKLTTEYLAHGERRKDMGVGPNVLIPWNTKLSVSENVFKKP